MSDETEYTHVGIKKRAQRQIAILAQVKGIRIYAFVDLLAEAAWQDALQAGLVTDAMIPQPEILPIPTPSQIRKGGKTLAHRARQRAAMGDV